MELHTLGVCKSLIDTLFNGILSLVSDNEVLHFRSYKSTFFYVQFDLISWFRSFTNRLLSLTQITILLKIVPLLIVSSLHKSQIAIFK
jgi:hypothetical protein